MDYKIVYWTMPIIHCFFLNVINPNQLAKLAQLQFTYNNNLGYFSF